MNNKYIEGARKASSFFVFKVMNPNQRPPRLKSQLRREKRGFAPNSVGEVLTLLLHDVIFNLVAISETAKIEIRQD